MVARKPTPETSSANNNAPPSITVQGVRQELWSPDGPDVDEENVWGDSGSRQHAQHGTSTPATGPNPHDVPAPLRPGVAPRSPFDAEDENPWGGVSSDAAKPKITLEHTPTVLRPGGKMETNPFKRKPVSNSGPVQTTTGTTSTKSSGEPVPPTEAFSELEVADSDNTANPWQPAIDEPKPNLNPPPIPSISRQTSDNDIWSSAPAGQPPAALPGSSPTPVSIPSGRESPGWDEVDRTKPSLGSMPERSTEAQEFSQDAHAWDDLGVLDKGKAPDVTQPQRQSSAQDEWNLIDHDPVPAPPSLSRQSTWENFADADEQPNQQAKETLHVADVPTTITPGSESSEAAPALPPRASEVPPSPPPRPNTPSAANKTETYQIKNINWFDASTSPNSRKSPILVQNANGPCPLVALVNALTLTTPANLPNTVLVETLRSREQISLNLLLEAVFDELMSPRRTNSDAALPDVSELYAFLKGLHTGMNVNPRFVPTPELVTAHKRSSTHVHPSERDDFIPGTFEDTRDMKLYATFSIPLIHGWLPPKDDPVNEAFARQAASYDETQNLMFREEELEDKLSNSSSGLTEQEQQIYQDILTIRSWLNSSATQLTQWGLEVITKAIQPGTFAILFRNDHFSTLYRHPQTQQLFTLVTDAGYYTHDEIVWESLVDVNGERAEFLSGDFRLVGGPQQQQAEDVPGVWYTEDESSAQGNDWQTVQNRRGHNASNQADPPSSPMSANHEQEDRDLALALQLQEEEDERHRNEQAARRRESQLSEQFIEQQGRGGPARTGPRGRGGGGGGGPRGGLAPARGSSLSVNTPPARGGSNVARGGRPVQQVRPLVPPPATTTHRPATTDDDDVPPSYEQASKAEPYVPPSGHPNHPSSTPVSATSARRRPTLPGSGPSQAGPSQAGPSTPMGMGRGRPTPMHQQSASAGRDKDCVVM
ncbi:hypothetical protein SUNI508_10800 [Seiridium unicorne]|uniref:MINDY deubiquitinase domain-containing protein n=1 Tax=Seiridium unicorne TaxID=138068 RepID=A0ABR2UJQ2_9PEZI